MILYDDHHNHDVDHRIGNPYYRFEELKQLWIGNSDWKMECKIKVNSKNQRAMFLVFEGVDTVADIKIKRNDNGQVVVLEKQVDNMFQYYALDVSKCLSGCDEFSIEVLLKSALQECRERLQRHYEEEQYEIPCPSYTRDFHTRGRNFLRKEGCSFGWDWAPCFATSGLHRPCYLVVSSNEVEYSSFIKDVAVFQRDFKFNRVGSVTCESLNANVKVYLHGNYLNYQDLRKDINSIQWKLHKEGFELTNTVTEWMISKDEELENTFIITFAIESLKDVELWYPNGYGSQALYNFEIIIDGPNAQSKSTNLGFRKVELDTSKDEFGEKFQFKVNEIPIYAKGSNWIPTDCFSSRSMKGKDHLEFLLKSAHDCHMNCMRVWGGGQYESEHFYNLCDKYGILLWHDLMFACSLYPSSPEFLETCRVEAVQQLRRLQHHPCIALYAGNNENEEALLSWPECIESPHKQRLFVDYHKLYYDTLHRVVSKEDNSRPYWPSSPSNGIMKYGNPQDLTRGDAHYWRVWHGGKSFDNYLTVTPRFSSEFGFQSLPSYESLIPFINDPNSLDQSQDANISSPVMEFRQRSYMVGNKCILEHVSREFRFPKSFKELVYISQILQGLSIKTACEHWRRQSKICSGVLYWQLNDAWVGNSWSSLEWNGKWKLLQYYARDFLAPSLLSCVENKENACLDIWFTTDSLQSLKLSKLTIELISFGNGTQLLKKVIDIEKQVAEASSQIIYSLDIKEVEKSRTKGFLKFKLDVTGQESIANYHFLTELKKATLNYSPVRVASLVEDDTNTFLEMELECGSTAPSLFTYIVIENDSQDTTSKTSLEFDLDHLSDNGFHLMPGEVKKITIHKRPSWRGTSSQYAPLIHIMNLRDSY
ncbi:predicted protein [Naegleria gruberi]|uniref:beta-mannosidase n=1 Tax=Naegleria gruberi TaxID=5762 RepID=D2V7K7_NAEGR|nr:uncharacterized protein NAEGRDRAFT_64838 [Naegleria gruberi]EFC47267.1 predicted protein [Naegleria gruberi]|eukprot:XP_002680011.1 predicted protein [Naegleria gruberi strain NEG-M]